MLVKALKMQEDPYLTRGKPRGQISLSGLRKVGKQQWCPSSTSLAQNRPLTH